MPTTWCWRNRHIKLIDGTTLFMPDTKKNQLAYPQSKVQEREIGFPICQLVAVISYVTGTVLDLAIGPCEGKETGEHALLRQIMNIFNPGNVILGDCNYASFFFIALLIRMGIDAGMPIHSGRHYDFRKDKGIEKKHSVKWQKPHEPNGLLPKNTNYLLK